MFKYSLLALAALALPAASHAQGSYLTSVNTMELQQLSVGLGHTVVETGELGATSIRAQDENGLTYLLLGTACDDNEMNCNGINMQVLYTVENPDYYQINQANLEWSAASVWYDPDSTALGISTYVILDHGQSMDNLELILGVLLSIAPEAVELAQQ
ncbi:MAG: YbjN domain-containing protein [Ponticaulis sp.]|nr:YbjN domain-containing protein [Ponticaulis sp.]